jgi:hypothetical protein
VRPAAAQAGHACATQTPTPITSLSRSKKTVSVDVYPSTDKKPKYEIIRFKFEFFLNKIRDSGDLL